MKKHLGIMFTLWLLLLGMLLAACGTETPPSDNESTQETADIEAVEDNATTAEEATNETATDTEIKGSDQDGRIPADCFDSDDAFWDCDDEGLIPDDCWDDDDYFIESCYYEADIVYVEPADEAADSGFRPEVDGFGFENYGDEINVINLTSAEMQRMFGDQVCATSRNGGCTLTPPARQWMEQMNESMSGGHCEGMAVLSSLMYYNQVDPNQFGADGIHELSLDNEALQREIAYWWVTQATWPGGYEKVNESPSVVLDTLIEAFADGKDASEWWALGIYKPDFSGGHAVTPYAVEDQGDGIYHIFVYDNNYPNEPRILEVDRNAETWAYEAAINPSVEADLYEGDAETQTLEVVAISPRLEEQEADFYEAMILAPTRGSTAKLQQSQDLVQIWLDGEADLLITTEDGRQIGWAEDGTFINEIEGSHSANHKFGIHVWDIQEEPIYHLPADEEFFTITVEGARLEEASPAEVTIIGPGYTFVVEELWLEPGESDTIEIEKLGPQYYGLTYISDYTDSPDIIAGIETAEADYEFIVRGTDIEAGGAFNVELNYPEGDFILNTTGQEEYGVYELLILRFDEEGEHVFGQDEIILEPNDTMYANFLDWEGEGSTLFLDFDYESDGTLDDYIELEDEDDFYDHFYDDWE